LGEEQDTCRDLSCENNGKQAVDSKAAYWEVDMTGKLFFSCGTIRKARVLWESLGRTNRENEVIEE
jgi:hypothetical protein